MIEARTNRRGLGLLIAVALLAGCKVIPKAPSGGTLPEPGLSDALPKDQTRHRVALLLPLSGPDAALGISIANATTMAVLDTNAQNLRITTYDTDGGVAPAARKALQDGNKLILGPLLSGDVVVVASIARGAKVPLIAYSSDPEVAADDVFLMGTTQDNSVLRVVEFARTKGITRFALLAPKSGYGKRVGAAYHSAVTAVGGTLVASDSYDLGNNSVLSAAARLKAKGGFQAVLIADAPRVAGQAAARLRVGPGNPRIIGTDLWSGDPAVSNTASLRGAWFAAVSDTRFRQFVSSYQTRFGEAPFRQATMGYDSVLLTVRIARDWKANTPFPYARLVDSGGFLGLDGPFRFFADGLNERALEVRETRAGGVTIVSPAPMKFVD